MHLIAWDVINSDMQGISILSSLSALLEHRLKLSSSISKEASYHRKSDFLKVTIS